MGRGVSAKRRFVNNEFWLMAWQGSVQRANLYRRGDVQSAARGHFQVAVVTFIQKELLPDYTTRCSEKKHLKNLDRLIAFASENGKDVLHRGRYKYGIAQKLLNLGLKYLWCDGQIAEPPHCPIDRTVIERTLAKGTVNWTEMTTQAQYVDAMAAISSSAKDAGESIAVWELNNFRRR